ncbi:unnamed protein product [Adineta steineri]|uniref:F-box domain-containing protein n=1 Tax=Adineta steineri TaxID=433720 RepID=A0A819LPN2_9BILA|nr:unnamed protein product [Adineta steineri]CAF3967848.1 unnamed protein product [Adineta steineri]
MTSINHFKNLPVELLFGIFDYLSFNDIIKSFFKLNPKLNHVIQLYPSKIVLRDCNDKKVFQFGKYMCRSLKIDADDHINIPMIIPHLNFTRLKAVTFYRKDPHFTNFPFDYVMNSRKRPNKENKIDNKLKSIYKQLWSMITTSTHYSFRHLNFEQIPIDLSMLEYLTLENITNQLSIHLTNNISLPQLRSFHLISHFDWSFEDFSRLFTMFPHLKRLHIVLFVHKQAMDDSSTWRTLIERYLSDLIHFSLHFLICEDYLHGNFPECDLRSFNDDNYWIERKSRFTVHEHRI